MEKERSIGQTTYKQLTKDDLIEVINKTFPNNSKFGTVAVVTTTSYGDYDDPTIMQSVTFGKLLDI